MESEEMKKATEGIRKVVEEGWKSDAPGTESAEALLAEATVAVNEQVRNNPRFTDEQRKVLTEALDEVKHEVLPKLDEGRNNVQYLNQVGGAENFVKYLMLDKTADKMDSPDFMNKLLHNGTMMFFHVSGWEQFTVQEIWEQNKRIKQMRSSRS